MKFHYLDSWQESASLDILQELDVSVVSPEQSNDQSMVDTNFEREHCSSAIVILSGPLTIDIRDAGDCWIRCYLDEKDALSIPPLLQRRIHGALSLTYEPLFRYPLAKDGTSPVVTHAYRELVCDLCRQFFEEGWVTGTGGSISIRFGNRIYMTPSGVQKERIQPDELFVLDKAGNILSVPQQKSNNIAPKLSDCSPLFLHAFQQRNAGAVLHSHSVWCNLATQLYDGENSFRISHQEMIKGIAGYGYFDELVIPIIENTAWEHELADSLGQTIRENPKACAVLVRRHGMYVWGATWEQAKRHGECLHYLFEIAVNLRRLGLSDLCAPPSVYGSSKKRQRDAGIENPVEAPKYKYVIFDIEGTTTPITFVRDVLFPYASRNAEAFLNAHWTDHDCVNDIKALIELAGPGHNSATALAAFVRKVISEDSKISALKSLQGKIWREAYSSGNLTSIVYNDVAACFGRLSSLGSRIAIYSSGSRDAQRLLFKHSNNGDLTGYISCYFDTSLGHKRSPASYLEILMNIGLNASDVLFVTDILEEAQAAKISGMHAYLSVRPGNLSLPAIHDFKVISTFEEIDI